MGNRKEARQILDTLRRTGGGRFLAGLDVTSLDLAGLYAALGDKDEAFRLLFKSTEVRDGLGVYVKVDPPLDVLHSDPRWQVLLRRMKLP
jgi:hypothetical protein